MNILEEVYNSLEKNAKGKPLNTHANIFYIFKHDPSLKDIVRTNDFTKVREIYHKPFWRRNDDESIVWTDEDEAQLFFYLGRQYEITIEKRIRHVLEKQFYDNKYNPVKHYLNSLKWDGIQRLETLFVDYLGAENTSYAREVTKISLVGAVKRVMEPGCKHDTALVLVGGQGVGKSTIISRLGMIWFNDSLDSFRGDEAYIKISGSWIIELAELSALKKADHENVKAFISSQEDIYRPKYGRNPIHAPRKCVFFGTTNNYEFLGDNTGNRRWHPVEINDNKRKYDAYTQFTQSVVDQIWAEATYYYYKGVKTFIADKHLVEVAKQMQEHYKEDNGLKGMIEAFLEIPIQASWYDLTITERQIYYKENLYKKLSGPLEKRTKICALEIWRECLNRNNEMSRKDATEINQILRNLDYLKEERSRFGQYGQQRGFTFK